MIRCFVSPAAGRGAATACLPMSFGQRRLKARHGPSWPVMARHGPRFGPDIAFLGVARCDWADPPTYPGADVVILGAPFDGGTSYRSGARFGPQYIRQTCYLPHDGSPGRRWFRLGPQGRLYPILQRGIAGFRGGHFRSRGGGHGDALGSGRRWLDLTPRPRSPVFPS